MLQNRNILLRKNKLLNISIAIPNSSLSDESTQLDKSRKISLIARACAIFEIDTIYVYHEGGSKSETSLIVTLLKYLETPQYLRRRLYPKLDELRYAGVLAPLKIPSHMPMTDPKKIQSGDIRDGVIFYLKGKKFVDVGIDFAIPYFGKMQSCDRVTVQFKKGHPAFEIKEVTKENIPKNWGYKVKERKNLSEFLASWDGNIILTSRKGKSITETSLKHFFDQKPLLVVFGSPQRGLYDILGSNIKNIQNSKVLNFFPQQATETVRLEEALLGSLSILNIMRMGYI